MADSARALARLAVILSCCSSFAAATQKRVHVSGRQLYVDGQPFRVRGICYSPTPVNESVYFAPYGDYFTNEYSYIWMRDLPLIKAMGVNVVRTYGWQVGNDHTQFIEAIAANGLYLFATFYMGEESETPVGSSNSRSKVIKTFQKEVKKYADNPALLFWSFGNELNGVWNGYLQSLSKDDNYDGGKGTACGWDERYDDLGGCWIHKGLAPLPGTRCYGTSYCVYKRLFTFINEAAAAAHEVADVVVVSAFADVDALYDKVGRAGDLAPDLDAWTAQVYRGSTFGDFYEMMGLNTDKPVLLTEYGVDAYHDTCGNSSKTPCYNTPGDDSGSFEDEDSQALFALNLTREIDSAASDYKRCEGAAKGDTDCIGIGGFLMSWTDEFWKGAKSQAACDPVQGEPGFSPKKCDVRAHATCGNWDASAHDLCGYPLEAAPDHYVNEEWFGITSPTRCATAIDSLRPRKTYWEMRKLWTGAKHHDHTLFSSCHEMTTGHCVALGDGGTASPSAFTAWLASILGGETHTKDGKPLPCSGRGKCTTNLHECGEGDFNSSATPCCSCSLGFAGVGCGVLDVKVYVALAGGGTLGALLGGMLLAALVSSCTRSRYAKSSPLGQRLLPN